MGCPLRPDWRDSERCVPFDTEVHGGDAAAAHADLQLRDAHPHPAPAPSAVPAPAAPTTRKGCECCKRNGKMECPACGGTGKAASGRGVAATSLRNYAVALGTIPARGRMQPAPVLPFRYPFQHAQCDLFDTARQDVVLITRPQAGTDGEHQRFTELSSLNGGRHQIVNGQSAPLVKGA